MLELQFEDMPDITLQAMDTVPELTELEVEELLSRLGEINTNIASAKERCNAFISHYTAKIERANQLFETETAADRAEITAITARLERYAFSHITGKKRSIQLPSGSLQLTKQQPKFTIGGQSAANNNPALIELARRLDTELVKVTETADWARLKARLKTDDEGNVYLKDTGELVPDMRAEFQPDKFTAKTI